MSDEITALTRRDFVRGSVGAAVAASLLGSPMDATAAPVARSYVAVVRNQSALNSANVVNELVLGDMLAQVLRSVTGKADEVSAWRALVKRDDVIGLVHTDHLNKTHPELIEAVKRSLKQAGFRKRTCVWPRVVLRPLRSAPLSSHCLR